jgi:hypothetical protein
VSALGKCRYIGAILIVLSKAFPRVHRGSLMATHTLAPPGAKVMTIMAS